MVPDPQPAEALQAWTRWRVGYGKWVDRPGGCPAKDDLRNNEGLSGNLAALAGPVRKSVTEPLLKRRKNFVGQALQAPYG